MTTEEYVKEIVARYPKVSSLKQHIGSGLASNYAITVLLFNEGWKEVLVLH